MLKVFSGQAYNKSFQSFQGITTGPERFYEIKI